MLGKDEPLGRGSGSSIGLAGVVVGVQCSVMVARGGERGKGQAEGKGAGRGRGGQRAEGRAARHVPARADRTAAEHTPRPRSAAASDLREEGRRASRAVAGAGCK